MEKRNFMTINQEDIKKAESLRTPYNTNELRENKFKFTLTRLPTVSFFCQTANIPGVSQTVLTSATPYNNINHGGNKLDFEKFNITFQVDEDLKNYNELLKWIRGITAPTSADEYKNLHKEYNLSGKEDYQNIYSDGTLISLTNVENYNVNVKYRDMFPIALSGIDFTYLNQDNVVKASATFVYLYYDIEI